MSGRAVLVVDDHEDFVDWVAAVLEHAGAIVYRATTLGDAMDRVLFTHVDAFVIDVVMPGASGLDFLRAVREAKHTAPAVALTAQLVPGTTRLIRAGFAAALFKPLDGRELVAVLETLAADSGGRTPQYE